MCSGVVGREISELQLSWTSIPQAPWADFDMPDWDKLKEMDFPSQLIRGESVKNSPLDAWSRTIKMLFVSKERRYSRQPCGPRGLTALCRAS